MKAKNLNQYKILLCLRNKIKMTKFLSLKLFKSNQLTLISILIQEKMNQMYRFPSLYKNQRENLNLKLKFNKIVNLIKKYHL